MVSAFTCSNTKHARMVYETRPIVTKTATEEHRAGSSQGGKAGADRAELGPGPGLGRAPSASGRVGKAQGLGGRPTLASFESAAEWNKDDPSITHGKFVFLAFDGVGECGGGLHGGRCSVGKVAGGGTVGLAGR